MSDSDDEYDPAAVKKAVVAPAASAAGTASSKRPAVQAADDARRGPLSERAFIDGAPLHVGSTVTTSTPAGPAVAADAQPHPSVAAIQQSGPGIPVRVGARVALLRGHKKMVRALTLNPAGNCLVTGSSDGSVAMWEYAQVATGVDWAAHERTGTLRGAAATRSITPFMGAVMEMNQPIGACTWLADGKHFVACEDGPQPILIKASGKTLHSCRRGQRHVTDVAATNGHSGTVKIATPSQGADYVTFRLKCDDDRLPAGVSTNSF